MKRQILKKDPQILIVKMNLEKGESIPEHHSTAYVTATTIIGKGIFTISNAQIILEPGVFIEIQPFEKHSITAHENLEIIVHHIALNQTMNSGKTQKDICGTKN